MTDLTPEQRAVALEQHIAWIRTYAEDMTSGNWRDVALRIKRQADGLEETVKAEIARLTEECERLTKVKDDSVWAEIRAHDRRAVAEAETVDLKSEVARLRAALAAARVFIQDAITLGHDRATLGDLYGARDTIDAALSTPNLQTTDTEPKGE